MRDLNSTAFSKMADHLNRNNIAEKNEKKGCFLIRLKLHQICILQTIKSLALIQLYL